MRDGKIILKKKKVRDKILFFCKSKHKKENLFKVLLF